MPNFDSPERLQALFAIANELKLKVTYIHDDIVFVEHNNFLFHLDGADDAAATARFNTECKPAEVLAYSENLQRAAAAFPALKLAIAGRYSLAQDGEGEMKLELLG